jgi:tetratricopeptide (TPR) repeat protein
MESLAAVHLAGGQYDLAEGYARRQLEFDNLRESAHRQLMEALTLTGRRRAALTQYDVCRRLLHEEMGIEPSAVTQSLYKSIRAGELEHSVAGQIADAQLTISPVPSATYPEFLRRGAEEAKQKRPAFVARQNELACLESFLQETLDGRVRFVFVSGEAGQGKTTLIREFAERAQASQPDLIVAGGSCSAYAGIGDPYLPFREVLALLSGDVEAQYAAGTLSWENARRLWQCTPETAGILLRQGPDLIDTFLSISGLAERLAQFQSVTASVSEGLAAMVDAQRSQTSISEQSFLFEQYATVLRQLAVCQPLLITLDDLQWADRGSISLLFHLGRRLASSRIMIIGAYRTEEIALGRDGDRHPMERVLNEFKRSFGDVWLDLSETEKAEGQLFVNELIDTQPNQLGERFREALFHRTGGHPLFTIELLRAMEARGDLMQNTAGSWIEASELDWAHLPARVEGAIEERLDRLAPELRQIIEVAAVEGETFTSEVVAEVTGTDRRQLLRRLSADLERRHRLVSELGVLSVGGQSLTRYRFGHDLIQQYLLGSLSRGEQRLWHHDIAEVKERLFEGRLDEIAPELARHWLDAGKPNRAAEYFRRAADRARRLAALTEATAHYGEALRHWPESDRKGRAELLYSLGECQWITGHSMEALASVESSAALFEGLGELEKLGATQRLMGQIYGTQGKREKVLYHHQKSLAILEKLPQGAELARTLSGISQMHAVAYEFDQAIVWGERAMALAESTGAIDVMMHTLNNVGSAYVMAGNVEHGLEMLRQSAERALALRLPRDVCRSYYNLAGSHQLQCRYDEAMVMFEELHAYASRTQVPEFIGAAVGHVSQLEWLSGHWAATLSRRQPILELLTESSGSLGMLRLTTSTEWGWFLNDLGRTEAARQKLEEELPRARSSSQPWSTVPHLAQLARAYALLDKKTPLRGLLQEVLEWIDGSDLAVVQLRVIYPVHICLLTAIQTDNAWFEQIGVWRKSLERTDEQLGTSETAACLAECRGLLAVADGDSSDAADHFRHALFHWEAIGRPYDRARALNFLGQALNSSREVEAAQEAFGQALGIVKQLSAQLEEQELKTSFLESRLFQGILAGLASAAGATTVS